MLRKYFDFGSDLQFSRPLKVERNKTIEMQNMLRFFFSGKYELTDDYFRLMKNNIDAGGFNQPDVAAAAQTILEDVVSRFINDRMNGSTFA